MQHEVESYAKAVEDLRQQSASVQTLTLQKPPNTVLPDVGGGRRSSRMSSTSSGDDVTPSAAKDPGPDTVRARAEFQARRDRELSVAKSSRLSA